MKPRTVQFGFAATVIAGLLWVFPLFRIVPLKQVQAERSESRFDAAEFAKRFWEDQLTPALDRAADARAVLSAAEADFPAAREQHGRRLGISDAFLVMLQGHGRVVRVDGKEIGVAIHDGHETADIVLPVALIFGNAVRDAHGLLDVSQFPNSQDFNGISTELNRLVETRVVPTLKTDAMVGRNIRFVGCAEIPSEPHRRRPLKIIPLRIEW
jgi:predicted lipoprotein